MSFNNFLKSYTIQNSFITNNTAISNEPFNQHLQHHIENFEPVLKELVKKDLDLFFAYPQRKVERANHITDLAEGVCATNKTASPLLKKYVEVLESMYSPISPTVFQDFQQNKKAALFEKIDNITSYNDLTPFEHFPSILHALKPIFQKLAAKNVDIIFQAAQQFEKLALILFEPILLTSIGITTFCSIILTFHFKKGAFIKLVAQLRSYTWAPYLPAMPIVKKTLSLSPISHNPTISLLTIGVVGGVFSLFPKNNDSFANVIANIRPPAKGPEDLQSSLTNFKALLEFTGAECFKVSTALMKGVITGLIDDNRKLLMDFIRWLESSKKN